jgi:hypothetical protein
MAATKPKANRIAKRPSVMDQVPDSAQLGRNNSAKPSACGTSVMPRDFGDCRQIAVRIWTAELNLPSLTAKTVAATGF